MNLHALMLFYNIALTGSVTGASKKLNISQPAISAQIRNFERQHNIILFEKKGRNMVLTPFGKKLLKPTEKLFSLEEQIEGIIEDHRNHPNGKLRLTGSYLATSVLIPMWASLFKQQHPEIEVHISTANSKDALTSLINFESDISIFGSDDVPEKDFDSLDCIELYQDKFEFVAATTHKYANQEIGITEIMKEPFIMREEGSTTRKKLDKLCEIHQVEKPKIELQFNGLNETIRAVIAGYGVSFVSSLVAKRFIKRGELAQVNVRDVNLTNTIILCSHNKNYIEEYIQNFISIALKNRKEQSI
ncbi:LysR family transcriptional regulator [Bacillus cereus]|nr:LysR family transcriptional regulator [Bacillus cereus]